MAWGRVLHLSKISTLCGGMFEVPSKYMTWYSYILRKKLGTFRPIRAHYLVTNESLGK